MKTFKRIIASVMVAVMVLTVAPLSGFVDLFDMFDFAVEARAASSYFSKVWASNVSATNAQINANLTGLNVTSSGFYIGTSTSNMKKVAENKGGYVEKIWYDLNKWYGTLKPMTKYYYKLYIVVSGKEYVTDVKNFTTEIYTKVWVSNISKTNAQLNADLTGFKLESSGFYIGTSTSTMKKVAENKGGYVEKIWYDLSKWYGKLTQGTIYYYRFYVVISGKEYTTDVKTFTTLTKQPVTVVKLNQTSATMVKGSSLQLIAAITPSSADNKSVTWSSDNTSVATVDSKGKVIAKSTGTATITVKTSDGGYTAKCTITVKNEAVSVTGVSLNKTKVSIFVGKTETLTAKIKPSNATNKNVTWSSSNTSVAKVDSNGKITAVTKGTATITAKTKDGNKTATCQITVKKYNENVEKEGTFILGDKNYNQQVTFDANWLQEYSYDYNHDLAQFCSLVSLLTYSNMSEIKKSLDSIGFSTNDNGIKKYWPEKKDTTYDKNCYVITKKSYTIEGKEQTVVMVMLRGTYGNEWYSNFDPGTGDTHQSFKKAKDFVKGDLIEYLKDNGLYNKDNVKLIITGHSRGAAVANLLAADLVTTTGVPQSYDTFTYTFATPNVTSKSERSKEIYKNIFNFVNPEDFVTKCVPAQWKYGRYGVTLTLPSKTNESKSSYKTYYNNMNSVFRKYKGRDYQPYSNGEEAVYKVVNKLTSTVPTINDFYSKKMKNTYATKMTPYEFFRDTLCTIVSETADKNSIRCAALYCYSATFDPIACDTYEQIVKFFIGNEALGILSEVVNEAINSTYFYKKLDVFVDYTFANRYFQDAHSAETYASYVTSMSYNQAYTWAKDDYRTGYKGTVNCPVDIEVYDVDTGELVGRIVDNKVDEDVASGENAIVMSVDGDSKSYWLPSSGNYEVKLIGTAEGIMNHTVSRIDEEIGEISRVNFEDVIVSDGFDMYSEYLQDETKIDKISLITELGETINYSEHITDFETNYVSVDATVEGIGTVTGELRAVKGDYVSLLASTDENNSFLGWYINETLISRDKEYSFVAKESIDLIAKFTNVTVDVSGIDIKEESLNLNLTGDNSFALLTCNILPQNATDKSAIWYSSDESIVKVNEFGVIEAVGIGTTKVTATTSDGRYIDSCTVNVIPRKFNVIWNVNGVESIQVVLEGSSITVPKDPKLKGFTFVSWDSEIPSVMPDYDLYFTAQFTPFTGKINSVSIDNLSLNYKDSTLITPKINADEGVNYTVSYSSSNDSVARVDSGGKVTATGTGSATITCTVTDEYGNVVTDSCEVNVSYSWWQWIIIILLLGFLWY